MDKKARRVTWAAGVVSPRPRSASRRARRRARQALLEAEEAACAQSSLLLPCPPNDGDLHPGAAFTDSWLAAALMEFSFKLVAVARSTEALPIECILGIFEFFSMHAEGVLLLARVHSACLYKQHAVAIRW